eukprot:CAMPEP_0119054932 /NCGR_PEP_ID=MMETSP1177-20130426/75402_1 /TAXON_ID=2985 /ORGANISM="Ochromonas sp, Strain CCMP1899" /LENGTH=521 /DNA_ID=CAMNT_0007035337 /DNA_START=683 /DNA_END=2245 /DNA_ORIENTATION=+
MRSYLLYLRIKTKLLLRDKVDELGNQMDGVNKSAMIKNMVYKQELEQWYIERKRKYQEDLFFEGQSKEQMQEVMRLRRSKRAETEKELESRLAAQNEAREEEFQISTFVAKWDKIKMERADKRAVDTRTLLGMHNSMLSKVEKVDKKRLLATINNQVKGVLRRADEQRVPMEIPEAREIAAEEVILMEVEDEKRRTKEDQKANAEEIEKARLDKLQSRQDALLEVKLRRRGWAMKVINKFFLQYLAIKILRKNAKRFYRKHWDAHTIEYYYEDIRNRNTFWAKPKSLGSYDVKCADGWVVMFDNSKDMYFYNPESWNMTWLQPNKTTLCDDCELDFAVARMTEDMACRCERCFNIKALEMLNEALTPAEVLFKSFYGCRENTPLFGLMKETNWEEHTKKKNDGESLEEEQKRLLLEAKMLEQGINMNSYGGKRIIKLCEYCNTEISKVICNVCLDNYCVACFDYKHRTVPWSLHTYIDIDAPPIMNKKKEKKAARVDDGTTKGERKAKRKEVRARKALKRE